MQFSRIAFTLILFFTLAIATACTSHKVSNSGTTANANTAAADPETPKDNIDEFQLLVRTPFVPEEALWKETTLEPPAADGSTKKLVAVVRYKPDEATKVSEQASKSRPGIAENLDTEPWYPAELIAQAGVSGEGKLTGESYSAVDFVNPPYTVGKVTRVDNTDYFILELFGR